MLTRLKEKNVQDGICYTLRNPQSGDPTLDGFGLLRADFSAKPSAHTFRSKPAVL
jgi:hypothetical protein